MSQPNPQFTESNQATDNNPGQLEDSKTLAPFLTIGALAKRCNLTVRTLRYYEELDLIGPVKRSSGKYRLYNNKSLKRINAIIALQGLNFSLEAIAAVLGPYSKSKALNREETIQQTKTSLQQQQTLIHGKIEELNGIHQDISKRLSLVKSVCEPCVQKACPDSCTYYDIHN